MTDFGEFVMWWGAASGSSQKALRAMKEPHIMLSHVTKNNRAPHSEGEIFADCGGYSMMHKLGEYKDDPDEYVQWVDDVGASRYAMRDYPCEPSARNQGGRTRTVRDHQQRSLEGHLATTQAADRARLSAEPVIVIQGWEPHEYVECIDLYHDHGLIAGWENFAIGSVCRRGKTEQVAEVIRTVTDALPTGANVHAFGVKKEVLGVPGIPERLDSVDSSAWYYRSHDTNRNREIEPAWQTHVFDYLTYRRGLVNVHGLDWSPPQQNRLDRYTGTK